MDPVGALVVAVIAVALAVAGLELALRVLLPVRLDAALSDAFGGPTTAELPAPPLLPKVARGHLSEVLVRATAVPIGDGDGQLDELDVRLLDVTFSATALGRDLRAGEGTFAARIDESSLMRLASLPSAVRDLELEADTLWVSTVAGVRFATTVDIRDGRIIVRPRSRSLSSLPFAELPIDLPELPAGATVTGIELHEGHVLATGPLDGDRLLDARAAAPA